MRRVRFSVAFALVIFAVLPAAQAQVNPPPAVGARIAVLGAACRAAGGTPSSARPYVFVHDFTGDGVNDYLISEGDFQCTGRPNVFNFNGRASIELWVAEANGAARQVHREQVVGYRIIDSRPRTLQVVRTGPACGPAQAGNCTVPLVWNPQTQTLIGPGSGPPGPPQANPNDPFAVAGAPPPGRSGQIPPPASQPASTAAARAPETQAQFMVRCRRERAALDRTLTARIIESSCESIWPMATAAGPAVDLLLAVAPAPGETATAASVRTRAPAVRWAARPEQGSLASGAFAPWQASVRAPGLKFTLSWFKNGDLSPFDVPEGFKVKGATVTEVACQAFGASESTRIYRVDAAGKAPFGLTVYSRAAAVASQSSDYNVTVDLTAGAPTLAALRRSPDYADFQARCD